MYPGDFANADATRRAIVIAESGEVVTYSQIHQRAVKLSNLLIDRGLKPGDHVAFCLENHPQFMEVVWGCHYAGLVYTACSSRLTSGELGYIINDCGAKAFITSAYKSEQALEVLHLIPGVTTKMVIGPDLPGFDSYEDCVNASSDSVRSEMLDGVDMLYSSGTTGKPKGVEKALPNTPIGTTPGLSYFAETFFGFTKDVVYLSPGPLYHASPLRFNMACHAIGATTIQMKEFDAEEFLANIEKYKVTHTCVVPTMFVRILKLDTSIRKKYDLSSLQCVIHAAAPCPIEIKKQMISWFGKIIHEFYAGTEGNGLVYCDSEQWLQHPGTVGVPVTAKVHVCEENGDEVPMGETGLIYFEGGDDFRYHNDPDKTAECRDPKGRGWTTLGDLGHMDSDGFLYLTDRKSFVIISGGVNIYPQESEDILLGHPKVLDAAVFGIPNEEFGEEVKAVVQPILMPTTPAEMKLLEQELIEECRRHLARHKCPRSIDFRMELPRHATGKLYKRLLKDEYWKIAGRNI